MHLDAIKRLYWRQYSTQYGEPDGSSEHEVRKLERVLKRRLPEAYREYLLWMGNDKCGRLAGSDWFLGNIHENTEFLADFLSENGLSAERFAQPLCFFVHQGCMAAWFDLARAQGDPDCYYFFEGSDNKDIEGPVKFTSFLAKDLGLKI